MVNQGIALALDPMNQVNSTVHTGYDFFSSPFSADPVIYSGRILMALLLVSWEKNMKIVRKNLSILYFLLTCFLQNFTTSLPIRVAFKCIATANTVEPADRASFVSGHMQIRLMDKCNGKGSNSLVYVSKPLINVITAIGKHAR